jgi:opacity protein-like surface antigen
MRQLRVGVRFPAAKLPARQWKGNSMISFGRSWLLGVALAVCAATAADAADLGGYPGGGLKDYGYQPQIVARNPSFYVRLDAGIAAQDRPAMVENGVVDLNDTAIGRTWTLGGGIGYYFARNVRGDITYDHRFNSDVSGYRFDIAQTYAAPGNDCHGGDPLALVQTSCFGNREFGLTSDVFLANLYYDFDCRCHITPYLGVGLGFVRHKTSSGTVVNSAGVVGDIDGATSTNVAAALMGGFSMQLRDHVAVDAGYRFLYLGETTTGQIRDRQGAVIVASDATVEQIHAHEFRVGLRYDFR